MVHTLTAGQIGRAPRMFWTVSARRRVVTVIVAGAAAAAVVAWFAPWQLTVLAGWDTAAALLVGWVWLSVRNFTATQTRAFATREDNSRTGAHLLLVGASAASLLGVGFDLVKAHQSTGFDRVIMTVIAVFTVAASWAVVHTTFALRYAHEYYTPPIGGIDFKTKKDEPPDYQDFAYIAFTVGMTFQVSDPDLQARKVRRTVLRHALLSFLFGAVILGVTINVIASLL